MALKTGQHEQVGVRLSPALKDLLDAEARRRDISPTSCAREILAWSLGYDYTVPSAKSPRRRTPTAPSEESIRAIEVLTMVQEVNFRLETLCLLFQVNRRSLSNYDLLFHLLETLVAEMSSIRAALGGRKK